MPARDDDDKKRVIIDKPIPLPVVVTPKQCEFVAVPVTATADPSNTNNTMKSAIAALTKAVGPWVVQGFSIVGVWPIQIIYGNMYPAAVVLLQRQVTSPSKGKNKKS